MLKFINSKYPKLKNIYEDIVYNDKNLYIDELRNTWKDDPRVNFLYD